MNKTRLALGLVLLIVAAVGINVGIGTGNRQVMACYALVGIVGAILIIPKDYR